MRRSVREFLVRRPEARVVRVESRVHPEARRNQCHVNSFLEMDRSPSTVVAGWIVGDYFPEHDSSPVMFHFWNRDEHGDYDVTPRGDRQTYTYLEDYAVMFDSDRFSSDRALDTVYYPGVMRINDRECAVKHYLDRQDGVFRWIPVRRERYSIAELLTVAYSTELDLR